MKEWLVKNKFQTSMIPIKKPFFKKLITGQVKSESYTMEALMKRQWGLVRGLTG